ncbi:MAG: hypothetical protein RLY93_03710 [Sumerlaeia bacterium]
MKRTLLGKHFESPQLTVTWHPQLSGKFGTLDEVPNHVTGSYDTETSFTLSISTAGLSGEVVNLAFEAEATSGTRRAMAVAEMPW